MNKKILYLASGNAVLNIPGCIVTYNDIIVNRDLLCDMLDVDLSSYDILIASPPCNFYSRANYRRETSIYSLKTRYLLPCIIYKFIVSGKPFIVENVINKPLMKNIISSLPSGVRYIEIGRHSYFTNVDFEFSDFCFPKNNNVQNLSSKDRQGNGFVNVVFERFCLSCL